jgi:hypothetical protein
MTLNTYTVMSGETYTVTAANADRARDVFLIEYGYMDGELVPGESCSSGDGETITLPDAAPTPDADALTRAVALIADALENVDPTGDVAARIGAALDLLTTGEHDCETAGAPCYVSECEHDCDGETSYVMTCGTDVVTMGDEHCPECCDCDDACTVPAAIDGSAY